MAEKGDLYEGCYEPSVQQMSPTDFAQLFCKRCRNPTCVRAGNLANNWEQRMSTNVDRLLDNPQYSDLKLPQHLTISQLDFKDLTQKALKLVISSQRNDWNPVSDKDLGIVSDNRSTANQETTQMVEDAVSKLSKLTGKQPKPEVDVEQEAPEGPIAELSVQELRRLRKIEAEIGQDRVPLPKPQEPLKIQPGTLPRRLNTSMPPQGIMIDGSVPPTRAPVVKVAPSIVDPWSPVKEKKHQPGARIVLGGNNGKV